MPRPGPSGDSVAFAPHICQALGQAPRRRCGVWEPRDANVTGKGLQRTAFVLLMGLIVYVWLNGG